MEKFDKALRVGDQIELRSHDNKASVLQVERTLGGICPASEGSPFYGCCFGQLPHANGSGKKPLIFLGEIESDLPEPFFEGLVEVSRKFFCWQFYYNSSDADIPAVESFNRLLWNYSQTNNVIRLRLSEGLTLDWNTGVLTIQQWFADKSIEIRPGTVLASQLGRMTAEVRHVSRRPAFWAVDALRALIGNAANNSIRQFNWAQEKPIHYYY